jgi:CubicO group peptidase (beta-lactamase class C family)
MEATERPATADELGLMQGTPPPRDRLVTLANWEHAPFHRWGFTHVRNLVPTACIAHGDGPVTPLERDEHDLDRVPVPSVRGATTTFATLLDETYTDAIVVLQHGRVAMERYANGMRPWDTHLLQSVSKSLTATLAGALTDAGRLHPDEPVTAYLPELHGTSWEGCTLQHLLDMRAGTRFDEDYENPRADVRLIEQVCGWAPRTDPDLPASLYEYIPTLSTDRPHGSSFDYRSVLTDTLGWALERAGGDSFAELLSEHVWRPLGAEFDADVTVDAHAAALADGGVCTTARDLARVGLMYLRDGEIGGRRVLPADWVHECTTRRANLVEEFRATAEAVMYPHGMYHNCWWVIDPSAPVFTGHGIHGQQLLVHAPADAVVAKLSTMPVAWDLGIKAAQSRALLEVCGYLESRRSS